MIENDAISRRAVLGAGVVAVASLAVPARAGGVLSNTMSRPRLRFPKPLPPGSHVRFVAPAGAIESEDELAKGVAAVEALGYRVTLSDHMRGRLSYFSGTDQERAADLMVAFTDPTVDGIICFRGGYGCARILPFLDFGAIREHAKVLIGYSDVTALHLAMLAKSNLVSFHGPVGSSTFEPFSVASMMTTLQGEEPTPWEQPPGDPAIQVIVPGKAKGRLIGGNLTVFLSLFGTPYMPDLKGAVLFFEDIGEEPYRIDRMLTQLRLGGAFDRAAAVLLGRFTNTKPKDGAPEKDWTIEEVFKDRLSDLKIPVLSGFAIGHIKTKLTVPVGVEAAADGELVKVAVGVKG